jgi:ferredoxin--NADP+ reductase
MATQKSELNAMVSHKIEVAPGLIVLRVVPRGWELPHFTPGQFAVLGLPPEATRCDDSDPDEEPAKPGRLIRRAYSVASSSVSREYLEFYINLVHSGSLTPRLFALEPGDRVWLGPKITGTFTLDLAPQDCHLALVATGTGLAPYMSMLRTMLPDSGERRLAVLLGARHSWDLGYHAELVTMQRLCPEFHYIPVVSRPDEEVVEWTGHTGYVMDLWRGGVLQDKWGVRPTPKNTRVFLCGNPAMIEDMATLLAEEGFHEHSRKEPGEVFVERYW